MENANGDDWREELYLKIRSIKEMCLPHLSDHYQTTVAKLEHQESLLPQQRSDQFEKLKQMKTTLERMIEFVSVPKSKIMPSLKHKIASYEKQIMDLLMMHGPRQLPQSQTIHGMQQNASSSKPGSRLEPGQGSGLNNGNGGDWQGQVFQKIQSMKEMYLPELNEIYQRVAIKVHQHQDSVPQQQRSDEFKKLIQLKTMLERMMQLLSVPKTNILPTVKDQLDHYEKQIIGFLNMHRARDTVQLSQSQMHQPQSHDNQTMKSMSMQVSGPRAQESSLPYMQNNVLSSLPEVSAPQQNIPSFILASSQQVLTMGNAQGNALNYGQQVLTMGSMLQNTSQQVNNGSASAQSGLWTLHPNVNQTQLSSILLQPQQQQDQLMQLKRKFQYRQMQQQELLQLLQQLQQMPQQMTQHLKQQFQYRQMQQQQLLQQVNQLQQHLQARQQDQQMMQQLQQHQMQQQQQQNMSSSIPASNLESGQGSGLNNANGSDRQEDLFQKLNSMKETYLADLNELYQRVVARVQQDPLPPQERSDNYEKQKEFKTVLEHLIRFLSAPKRNISPSSKDKLDYIETQIIRYLNAHRPPQT